MLCSSTRMLWAKARRTAEGSRVDRAPHIYTCIHLAAQRSADHRQILDIVSVRCSGWELLKVGVCRCAG